MYVGLEIHQRDSQYEMRLKRLPRFGGYIKKLFTSIQSERHGATLMYFDILCSQGDSGV